MKIRPYFFRLFKENFIFFAAAVVSLVILAVALIYFINRHTTAQAEIEILKSDISGLRLKNDFINYKEKLESEGFNIDELNKIMGTLVPDEEDYFSIISALESLSQKTNFIITAYTVNISQSSPGKISLTIEGTGDQDSFLGFLKDYNFSGYRLITVDKIDYSKAETYQITLQLNFYNGKAQQITATGPIALSEEDKKVISSIKDKVTFEFELPIGDVSYDTKSNPF